MKTLYSHGQLQFEFHLVTDELKEMHKRLVRWNAVFVYFENKENHIKLYQYCTIKWFELYEQIFDIENPEFRRNIYNVDEQGRFINE